MQPIPSAGKHATNPKPGKTCNHSQARENMPNKNANGTKRGKTCDQYQAPEKITDGFSVKVDCLKKGWIMFYETMIYTDNK